MDVTELNQKVSEIPKSLDIREKNEKFNVINKTNALVFKVRSRKMISIIHYTIYVLLKCS